MFVGIPHPGEAPSGNNDPLNPRRYSIWADANEHLDPNDVRFGRPRSSLIVSRKDNGGDRQSAFVGSYEQRAGDGPFSRDFILKTC